MNRQEVHLDLLLDTCVLDRTGKSVGRIEEIQVRQQGNTWLVDEYHIGATAFLERFSARTLGLVFMHLFGGRKLPAGRRIPWDKLDLSDPARPLLLCDVSELKSLARSADTEEGISP